MSEYILEIKNLCKSFYDISVLKDVSLCLEKGKILGIFGKNASAKTTLAKTISGIIQPDSGEIFIDGNKCNINSSSLAHKLGITTIYEDFIMFRNMTVTENIYFGEYNQFYKNFLYKLFRVVDSKKINVLAQKLCNEHHLSIDVTRKLKYLSAAEQQLVSILHAIVQNPKILILDECFTAMDQIDLENAFNIIHKVCSKGVGVIFVSQNLHMLSKIADSIAIIDEGAITEQYPTQTLMSMPHLEKTGIGKSRPFPKLPTNKGKIFFVCKNLCYKNIIKDVSFDVYEGEILGVIGISGSGRSTIARIISGDLRPSIGKTYIKGKPVELKNTSVARKNKITLISDDTMKYMLIPESSLTDNVSLNNYKSACNQTLPFIIKNKKLRLLSLSVINRLGVTYQSPEQRVRFLSAGNQKKIAFSRSIFSGSKLFLLDEPTLHVDTAGRLQIYNIMNELSRQGKSIVFFTADIDEALGMCDRLLLLRAGEIVCEYVNTSVPAEEIFKNIYL